MADEPTPRRTAKPLPLLHFKVEDGGGEKKIIFFPQIWLPACLHPQPNFDLQSMVNKCGILFGFLDFLKFTTINLDIFTHRSAKVSVAGAASDTPELENDTENGVASRDDDLQGQTTQRHLRRRLAESRENVKKKYSQTINSVIFFINVEMWIFVWFTKCKF